MAKSTGSCNIKVGVRIRPTISREANDPIRWKCDGNRIFRVDPETGKFSNPYDFDKVYDATSTNRSIFDSVVEPMIMQAVEGFNATILAYGQTSSGKTHTMMGSDIEKGIVTLTMEYIFEAIDKLPDNRCFILGVSFVEVYNEKIRDLLSPDNTDVKIKETHPDGIKVDCKTVMVSNHWNMLDLLKEGNQNKAIGETNMNDRSSRSHTIFRITIESQDQETAQDECAARVSHINLVDLAGSERAAATGAIGQRYKEGCAINRSLLQLGNVVQKLSEDKGEFIDYRSSKLTRILQSSLSGNANIAMICNITPVAAEQTNCTLQFAARASTIKLSPHLNEVMDDATLIKRHAKRIRELEKELEKTANLQEENAALAKEMDKLRGVLIFSSIPLVIPEDRERALRRQTWGGLEIRRKLALLPTLHEEPFGLSRIAPDRMDLFCNHLSNVEKDSSLINLSTISTTSIESHSSLGSQTDLVGTPVSARVNENERADTPPDILRKRILQLQRKVDTSGTPILRERIRSLEAKISNLSEPETTPAEILKQRLEVVTDSPLKTPVSTLKDRIEAATGSQTSTPPVVLKEQISKLTKEVEVLEEEYKSLQEFTTLERQCLADAQIETLQKEVVTLKNTLYDYENMYKESNQCKSNLLDDNRCLQEALAQLQKELETNKMWNSKSNEQQLQWKKELVDHKEKLGVLLNKSKDWMDEKEILKSMYENKIAELQKSLSEAWTQQDFKQELKLTVETSDYGCQTDKAEETIYQRKDLCDFACQTDAHMESLGNAIDNELTCKESLTNLELTKIEISCQTEEIQVDATVDKIGMATFENSETGIVHTSHFGCQTELTDSLEKTSLMYKIWDKSDVQCQVDSEDECDRLREKMFFMEQEINNLKMEIVVKLEALQFAQNDIEKLKTDLTNSNKTHALDLKQKEEHYLKEIEKLSQVNPLGSDMCNKAVDNYNEITIERNQLIHENEEMAKKLKTLTQICNNLQQEKDMKSLVQIEKLDEEVMLRPQSEELKPSDCNEVFEYQHDSWTISLAEEKQDISMNGDTLSFLQGINAEELKQQSKLLHKKNENLSKQLYKALDAIKEKGLLSKLPDYLTGWSPDVNEYFKQHLHELEDSKCDMEVSLSKLKLKIETLEEEKALLESQINSLKADSYNHSDLLEQISNLKQQLSDQGYVNNKPNELSADVSACILQLTSEIRSMNPEITTADLNEKNLSDLINTFICCIIEKQQECFANLQSELQKVELKNSHFKKEIEEKNLELEELKSNKLQHLKESSEIDNEVLNGLVTFDRDSQEIQELRLKLREIEEQYEKEVSDLKLSLAESIEQSQLLEKTLSELQIKYTDLIKSSDHILKMETNVLTTRQSASVLAIEISEPAQQEHSAPDEGPAKELEVSEVLLKCEDSNTNLMVQERNEKCSDNVDNEMSMKEQIIALKRELESSQQQVSNLEHKLNECSRIINAHTNDKILLESKISELSLSLHLAEEKTNALINEIDINNATKQDLILESNDLRSQILSLQEQLNTLSQSALNSEGTANVSQEIQNFNDELKFIDASATNEDLLHSITLVKEEHILEQSILKEQLTVLHEKSINTSSDIIISEKCKLSENLQTEMLKYQEIQEDLKLKLAKAEEKCNTLEADLQHYTEIQETLASEKSNLERELGLLKEQLSLASEEKKTLQLQLESQEKICLKCNSFELEIIRNKQLQDELNHALGESEKKLESMKNDLQVQVEANGKLLNDKFNIETQFSVVQNQFTDLSEKHSNLALQLHSLQNLQVEYDELQLELGKAHENLTAREEEFKMLLKSAEEKLSNLQQEHSLEIVCKEKLISENVQLQDQVSNSHELFKKLSNDYECECDRRHNLNIKCEKLESELLLLERKIKDQSDYESELNEVILNYKNQLGAAKSELECSEANKQILIEEKRKLKTEHELLQSQFSELAKEFDDTSSQLQSTQNLLLKYGNINEELERNKDIKLQLQQAQDSELQIKNHYESVLSSLHIQINEQNVQYQELDLKYCSLGKEKEKYDENIFELKEKLSEAEQFNSNLQEQLMLQNKTIQDLKIVIEQFNANYNNVKLVEDDLKQQLENALNKAQKTVEECDKKYESQELMIESLQNDLAKSNMLLNGAQDEKELLIQRLDKLVSENKELKTKLEAAEDEFQDMLKCYHDNYDKRVAFEEQSCKLEAEVEKLNAKMQSLETKAKLRSCSLEASREIQKELEDCQKELQLKSATLVEMESKIGDTNEIKAKYDALVMELQRNLADKRGEIALLQKKMLMDDLPHQKTAEIALQKNQTLESKIKSLKSEIRHLRSTREADTFYLGQPRHQASVSKETQTFPELGMCSVAVQAPPDNDTLFDRRDGYLPASAITEAARMYGMRQQLVDLEAKVKALKEERIIFKDTLRTRLKQIAELQNLLSNKENGGQLMSREVVHPKI